MSVLFDIVFACLCVVAIATLAASVRRVVPAVRELRAAMRDPADMVEIRLRVEDRRLVPVQSLRRHKRHLHRPKPIRHRLHGHNPRRAIA